MAEIQVAEIHAVILREIIRMHRLLGIDPTWQKNEEQFALYEALDTYRKHLLKACVAAKVDFSTCSTQPHQSP